MVVTMAKLIEEVKAAHGSWLFDENGNLSDNVIAVDTVDLLEALAPDEYKGEFDVDEFKKSAQNFYSYNSGNVLTHDISLWYKEDSPFGVLSVHLSGDARWGFSDDVVINAGDEDENALLHLLYLDETSSLIDLNDEYYADLNAFSEEYPVYNTKTGELVDYFYDVEKEDVLKAIAKEAVA